MLICGETATYKFFFPPSSCTVQGQKPKTKFLKAATVNFALFEHAVIQLVGGKNIYPDVSTVLLTKQNTIILH